MTDYTSIIETIIRRRLIDRSPDSTLDAHAVATAAAVLGLPFELPPPSSIVDALGHHRAIYSPLTDYGRRIATASTGNSPGRKAGGAPRPPGRGYDLRAADGAAIAAAAWAAIPSAEFFGDLCRRRNLSGGFLIPGPADNLESYWYHELQLLHAVDAYADLNADDEVKIVARSVARYHHDVTQPDHATGEPWALSAFLKSPETWPTADGLLHAAVTADPTGPRGVSLLLLADVLYRLRRDH